MTIQVPGDKSLTQRALILAALSRGDSRLRGLLPSADPRATAAALGALGAVIPAPSRWGGEILVRGRGLRGLLRPDRELDLDNSGTGARLLLGVLAGQGFDAVVTGDASLRSRPMRRITDPLTLMGARFEELGEPDRLPLRVTGGVLGPLEYDMPMASAQVKSAILLAGLVGGGSVVVTEPARSRDHTERMLWAAGVSVRSHGVAGAWRVELKDPPDHIEARDVHVPGDFSSAAFLLVLALLGGAGPEITVSNVGLNPTRTGLLPLLARMGARLEQTGDDALETQGEPVGSLTVGPCELRGIEVGPREIPGALDEIPILAVAASRAQGTTRITGAGELRVKETDRLRAVAENLAALGVRVAELDDGLEIEGSDEPLRGTVRSYDDHRIAMAFGVLAALPGNDIQVDGAAAVDVSYPSFWATLRSLARGPRPASRADTRGSRGGPVITIDGPAGSGKSTTAREVAHRMGFRHLDSGALYRAVTWALLDAGVGEDRWEELTASDLEALDLHVEPAGGSFRLSRGSRELGEELRDTVVTARVSRVSGLAEVRWWLIAAQRDAGERGGLVADGRDMGTVVFPHADVKVFLVADIEERARRRLLERGEREPSADQVREEAHLLRERDRMDSTREHAPLRRADDAVDVDTTRLSFEEQVSRVVDLVRRRQGRR
ncbi:MAG TPA: 3-phosphoshikimate 1-carboxyvinyltransferase [Longimicrobiales bacterium]|jgi:3-phosphoshikimate 1-carboxyvinyltransferase